MVLCSEDHLKVIHHIIIADGRIDAIFDAEADFEIKIDAFKVAAIYP